MQRFSTLWILSVASAGTRPGIGGTATCLTRIGNEAASHSQVEPVFDMFTVTIGPRLIMSALTALRKAAE